MPGRPRPLGQPAGTKTTCRFRPSCLIMQGREPRTGGQKGRRHLRASRSQFVGMHSVQDDSSASGRSRNASSAQRCSWGSRLRKPPLRSVDSDAQIPKHVLLDAPVDHETKAKASTDLPRLRRYSPVTRRRARQSAAICSKKPSRSESEPTRLQTSTWTALRNNEQNIRELASDGLGRSFQLYYHPVSSRWTNCHDASETMDSDDELHLP